MKRILGVGCLAGLAAGVAAALFAATAGRGPIRDAIALEDSISHATSGAHHEDLFSRGVQEIGGAIGLIVLRPGTGHHLRGRTRRGGTPAGRVHAAGCLDYGSGSSGLWPWSWCPS